MLARGEPAGALVFYYDYKLDPRPEFWATEEDVFLEKSPGLSPNRWMWLANRTVRMAVLPGQPRVEMNCESSK